MDVDCSSLHQDAEGDIADTPLSDGWHQPLTSHLQEMSLEDTRTLYVLITNFCALIIIYS